MAAGATPLSLAYLIEISFVLNLAYHELNTFRLRSRIRKKAKESQDNFRNMNLFDSESSGFIDALFDERNQLRNFHTGECNKAWNAPLKRGFYRYLIYCGRDRCIIRTLLFFDVLILLVCTAFAGSTIANPFSFDDFGSTLWTIGYYFLAASILVPACFMYWTRCCTRYALGSVEEDPESDSGGNPGSGDSNGRGRLHELEQIVLHKGRAFVENRLNS